MGRDIPDFPSVVSREKALEILGPWRDDLLSPILHGWNSFWRWKETDPDFYAIVTPRTRASIVHDYLVSEAKRRFANAVGKGVMMRTEFESILLIFGEHLVLRFKKLSDDGKASNSKTRRQDDFDRQCLELQGIPPKATKVAAGYVLNREQTEIDQIIITCWCMHRREWAIQLYDSTDGASIFRFDEPMPDLSDQPMKSVIRPAIREKKTDAQED